MFFEIINKIKSGYHHNFYKRKLNFNKKDYELIKLFIQLGIIKNVFIEGGNHFVFFSYYNNKKKFLIKNMYKPSHKKYIKLNLLKKMVFKKNWILILSTNKGIITSTKAVKLKVGGLIIAKIWN